MYRRLWTALRRGHAKPSERIVTTKDGVDYYRGDEICASFKWEDVDTITAYKVDLFTEDSIYLDIGLHSKDEILRLSEEVDGFWELPDRIREVFPDSQKDWIPKVSKPAFQKNLTQIYARKSSE